jgi:hypothetical protein
LVNQPDALGGAALMWPSQQFELTSAERRPQSGRRGPDIAESRWRFVGHARMRSTNL